MKKYIVRSHDGKQIACGSFAVSRLDGRVNIYNAIEEEKKEQLEQHLAHLRNNKYVEAYRYVAIVANLFETLTAGDEDFLITWQKVY